MKAQKKRKQPQASSPHQDIHLNLFREITDAVPAMIAVYSLKTGEYTYVNKAIRKLLGYSPGDFTKKGLAFVSALVHPEDVHTITEKNLKSLEEANKTGSKQTDRETFVNFEYRMRHKNGDYRWLHTDGSVFKRDDRGKVEYVLNVSIDITDRKNAEEKILHLHNKLEERVKERTGDLVKIEERYKTFVSQSTEGIWRFELDKPLATSVSAKKQIDHFYSYAYLAECNDSLAKMYGFSKAKDIIGARLGDMLIRDDSENIKYLSNFIKSGYRLSDAESTEKDKDGNIRYFQNSLVGIIENGHLVRAWGTQRDITEKRKSEEELSNSRNQLETILTGVADGISVQGVDGKLLFANPAIAKATGFGSVKEMLKAHPAEFLNRFEIMDENGDPLPLTDLPGRRALLGEKNVQETVRFVNKKTGEIRWAIVKATPVFNKINKVKFSINIIQDITEQMRTRRSIEESEEKYRSLFATMDQGFCIIEMIFNKKNEPVDYRFIETNPMFEKHTGLKNAVGKTAREMLPDLEKHWFTTYGNVALTGNSSRFIEGSDAMERWFEVYAFRHGAAEKRRVALLFTDITERKKLEGQKDDFLSIASHELKTPVTSLKAYAQVLRNKFVREGNLDSARHLAKMDTQLNKLTNLIVDLLDVTKIEGGKLQFHQGYFDFNELVSEVVEEMQRTTRHMIVAQLVKSKTVFGDRDRIGQVIMNFINNAIKYSPKSDRIVVKTITDHRSAQLSVQDFGVGIPKDSQPHVFERFFRAGGKGKETYPGLGLGLFISSEIVKRHKGKMWVESKEGKGSTFYFTLPLKPEKSGKHTKHVGRKDKNTDNNRSDRSNKYHAR